MVDAISSSSISSYSTSYDSEYEYIKKMMQSYGLTLTGDKNVDKATLEKYISDENGKIQSAEEENVKSQGVQSYPQYYFMLTELGLSQDEDMSVDRTNIEDALMERINSSNTSEEKKAYYQNLYNSLDLYFQDTTSQISSAASSFTGATMLGNLNRVLLGI